MNLPGPLRSTLFRRRRKLPLDGKVAGVEYPRFRGPIAGSPTTGAIGQRPFDLYNNEPLPVCYDPGIGPYMLDSPDYIRPEPWHDAVMPSTPSLGPGVAPVNSMQHPIDPPIDPEHAGWVLRQFVNDVPREDGPDNVDIHELFDPNRTVRLKIGEIHDHFDRINAYDASVQVGAIARDVLEVYQDQNAALDAGLAALRDAVIASRDADSFGAASELPGDEGFIPAVDATSPDAIPQQDPAALPTSDDFVPAPDAGMVGNDLSAPPGASPDLSSDPMSAALDPTEPAPDQLRYGVPLEDIVAQEAYGTAPYATPYPDPTYGPYGSMPDPRMMGMPMAPFMPMPPGFGPIGPGM